MRKLNDSWFLVNEMCSYLPIGSDTVCRWSETLMMPVQRIWLLFKLKISESVVWVKAAGTSLKLQKVN